MINKSVGISIGMIDFQDRISSSCQFSFHFGFISSTVMIVSCSCYNGEKTYSIFSSSALISGSFCSSKN